MMRVGMGYDIHRLAPGRRLVLGGVTIDYVAGLEGHSDADVLVHALMDAMLGAVALGDIGVHFPPTDQKFRDVSSLELLATVRDLAAEAGYTLVNADMVVVAERPKIAPHVDRMRDAMSAVLQVDRGCLNVKATTNEGVGPEGRGEAISARAVCLLEKRRD